MEPNSPTREQLDFERRRKLAVEDCKYLEGCVSHGYDIYSLRCKQDYYERSCTEKCSKYEFQLPEDKEKEKLLNGIKFFGTIIIVTGILIWIIF